MFNSFHRIWYLLIVSFLFTNESKGFVETLEHYPILWRIEGTGRPSYIVATSNFYDKRFLNFHPKVTEAFNRSNIVFPKISWWESQVRTATNLKNGRKIQGVLNRRLLLELNERLKQTNSWMKMNSIEQKKIWVIAYFLLHFENPATEKGTPSQDDIIAAKSKTAPKRIKILHAAESWYEDYNSLEDKGQILMLQQTLKFLAKLQKEKRSYLHDVAKTYESGNIEALGELLFEWMQGDLRKQFLTEILPTRNKMLATEIIKHMESNPSKSLFIPIRAQYLWGESSVTKLLEKEGIKIVRIQ